MGGWLETFAKEGYINWSLEGDRLEVIQIPTQAQ